MTQRKILFVESGVHEGGSFKSLEKHISALDRTQVEPVVVFFNDNGLIKKLQDQDIKVFLVHDNVFSKESSKIYLFGNAFFMKGLLRFGVIKFLQLLHHSSITSLVKICVSERIEFVHLNTELFRDRIGLLVAARLKIPVISHLRSKYQIGSIFFSKEYIKFANRVVTKYVAVSNDTANFWINEVGVDKSKTKVLYDYYESVNVPESSASKKEDGNLNFVCVANLVPVKAHDFLLKSLAPTLKATKANLLLVGKGDTNYTAKLKDLVNELGVSHSVKFLGFRTDVPQILSNADIVFLLSKREGLPNILIEALGAGKIVVASKVGGIPEIIQNNETGFLVTYGDENEVRNIVQKLIRREVDLEMIEENARSKTRNMFSIDEYKKIITSLYE
ncbi:glycosyltransferase [Pontibacter litorisediminis]|uniref:glycosyltransferase n=1 Tax=Pontibacter litorisediminis TaxID=1846260 RepID=UPI0023EDD915|nr:glycosyltransferase [Pontibacter litorisediminis]